MPSRTSFRLKFTTADLEESWLRMRTPEPSRAAPAAANSVP
jgi:hypothetical protein